MSKVITDAIEHSTAGSLTTDYVVKGSTKAWANLNGTGTIALRDSFNVASVTDNGTGDYTFSFTSSLSANDFVCTASSGEGSTHGTRIMTINEQTSNSQTVMSQTTSTFDDTTIVCISVHGDLA